MGEQIVIGEDIVITVVDTRNDTVRLGISAPRSVRVDRAELLRAVAASNQEAADADDSTIESLRALGLPATAGSARATMAAAAQQEATAGAPAPPSQAGAAADAEPSTGGTAEPSS